MPDQTGKLSQAEKDAVFAHLQELRIMGPSCPICRSQQWHVEDYVVTPARAGASDSSNDGAPITPMVMLTSPCGYVLHFAAKAVGVAVG